MKKREAIFFFSVIALFFSFFPIVNSRQVNATIISFQENYSSGDKLNITFLLNFTELTPDWQFETSEGHKIPIRELIKLNEKELNCERDNCEKKFLNSSGKLNSIIINPSTSRLFGLLIKDNSPVNFEDIEIRFSTSFAESPSSQIGLNIANNSAWEYFSQTENYNGFFSSGCFDASRPFNNNVRITETRYCEKIFNIPKTKRILLAANFTNPNNQNNLIKMSFLDRYKQELEDCTFNSSQRNFCVVDFVEEFSGEGYVCISSEGKTDLYLGFQQNQNPCGLFGSSQSNGDYYLFIRMPTYSAFNGQIALKKENLSSAIENRINNFLTREYGRNCSFGCFIPFYFYGINQNLNLQQVRIFYRTQSGYFFEEGFYNVSEELPKETFLGNLSLLPADFLVNFVGRKEVSFYLTREQERILLFSGVINSTSRAASPKVIEYYPKKFPALINVSLNIETISNENISRFLWYFEEDNKTIITLNPRVNYIFKNLTTYNINITLETRSGNYSSKIAVEVLSPKNISKYLLEKSFQNLENLTGEINRISSQRVASYIKSLLNLSTLEGYLNGLERKLEEAVTDEEILSAANEIFLFSLPSKISVEKKEEPFFLSVPSEQILAETINILLGRNADSKYSEYVSFWMVSKISDDSKKIVERVKIFDEINRSTGSFTSLTLKIKPSEDAILFVSSQNILSSSHEGEAASNFRKVLLNKNTENNLEFVFNGTTEPQISILPKDLAKVQLSIKDLGVCNFNKVCEKDLGENYKNCRSDCKPWGIAITLIVIIFIVTFILYFLIVSKLKEAYEKKLFKSERDLLNVISFFKSYEEKGLSRQEAIEKLTKSGWTREQAVYASKKAKGERTRPYEIIPIDKIKMLFNKK
ncbi:MAG: hypothetical protein QXX68_03160 [Candidatus Pacearchaeota archaeon]